MLFDLKLLTSENFLRAYHHAHPSRHEELQSKIIFLNKGKWHMSDIRFEQSLQNGRVDIVAWWWEDYVCEKSVSVDDKFSGEFDRVDILLTMRDMITKEMNTRAEYRFQRQELDEAVSAYFRVADGESWEVHARQAHYNLDLKQVYCEYNVWNDECDIVVHYDNPYMGSAMICIGANQVPVYEQDFSGTYYFRSSPVQIDLEIFCPTNIGINIEGFDDGTSFMSWYSDGAWSDLSIEKI